MTADAATGLPRGLLLVRHGESEGNLADRRAQASRASRLELTARDADVELSGTGRRQAEALGAWVAGEAEGVRPTAVLSSPYQRAASTADMIAKACGLPVPAARDERLRERDLGMFDGLTGAGIRELFPDEAERRASVGKLYYRPPGGESWCDVALRVRSVLERLSRHPDDVVLVVSHQAVIMNFRYVLEELSESALMEIDAGPPVANCSVTSYARVGEGALELDRYNDVRALAHLDEPVTAEADRDVEA